MISLTPALPVEAESSALLVSVAHIESIQERAAEDGSKRRFTEIRTPSQIRRVKETVDEVLAKIGAAVDDEEDDNAG